MQIKQSYLFTSLLQSAFILLFTYTGISKMLDHVYFSQILSESLPIHKGAGVLAWLIPATELAIVLLLFLPARRLTGMRAAVLLLLIFTGYLLVKLLSGSALPCRCGGVISQLSWKGHVVFNVLFIVAGLVGIRLMQRRAGTS